MEVAAYQILQYRGSGALMEQAGHAFNMVILHTVGSELLELVSTGVYGCDSISRFIKGLDKLTKTRLQRSTL